MVCFSLWQIVFLWEYWGFVSKTHGFTRDIMSTWGKEFVFSCFPSTYKELYLETRVGGEVQYQVWCARNCQGKYTYVEGVLKYTDVAKVRFIENTLQSRISGKHYHVQVLRATSPISVRLCFIYNSNSIAATYMLPNKIASTNYYSLTSYSKGRLMIFSLDYTRTVLNIFLKNNTAYKKKRPVYVKDLPNHAELRTQKNPEFQFIQDIMESERVKAGTWATITMFAYDLYYIEVRNDNSDLSGTQIKSDNPVSVLQGADHQGNYRGSKNSDIFLDHLPPVDTLGRYCIISFCSLSGEIGDVKIVTSMDENDIAVQVISLVSNVSLQEASDWFDFSYTAAFPIFVLATHPIYVLQTITDTASLAGSGPCMKSVDPVERWTTVYRWRNSPSIGGLILKYYANIVIRYGYEENVVANEETISQDRWEFVKALLENETEYSYCCFAAASTSYEVYVKDHPAVRFTVTLSGYRKEVGVCLSLGSTYPKINRPLSECTTTYSEPGDLIDNDCDGRFDEEIENDEDDDNDTWVDEDLQPGEIVNGQWGDWSVQECVVPCGQTEGVLAQKRICNNPPPSNDGSPCPGEDVQGWNGNCTGGLVMCADMCADKRWGDNCSHYCSNCATPCNKHYGTCDSCVDGFTSKTCTKDCPVGCKSCDILLGVCRRCNPGLRGLVCSEVCPKTFYGTDCSSSCSANCQDGECDSIDGHCLRCPDGKWGHHCAKSCRGDCHVCSIAKGICPPSHQWLMFLLIFVVCFIFAGLVASIPIGEREEEEDAGSLDGDSPRAVRRSQSRDSVRDEEAGSGAHERRYSVKGDF